MSTASYKGLVLFKKIKAHHTFKENDKKKDFAAWDTYSYSKSAAASVN